MANFFQWIGLAFCFGVVGFGVFVFFPAACAAAIGVAAALMIRFSIRRGVRD